MAREREKQIADELEHVADLMRDAKVGAFTLTWRGGPRLEGELQLSLPVNPATLERAFGFSGVTWHQPDSLSPIETPCCCHWIGCARTETEVCRSKGLGCECACGCKRPCPGCDDCLPGKPLG